MTDAMSETYDLIESRRALHEQNPNFTIGIRTGLKHLDAILDGIRLGEITTFAAETGMGKTALILSILLYAARKGINHVERRGAKILLFSGEMNSDTLNMRLIAIRTGIQFKKIERGNLTQVEYSRFTRAVEEIANLDVTLWEGERANVEDVETAIRLRGDVDMVILDGIDQLDHTRSTYRQDQDWQVVGIIMNELERVAKDLNVAIVVTSQLNRSGYSQYNSEAFEPSLANLARSSNVEKKSARVIFIYEADVENPGPHGVKRMCKIAKNRHGPTATFPIAYKATQTLYTNYEPDNKKTDPPPPQEHWTENL